jgi:hypothetical protein
MAIDFEMLAVVERLFKRLAATYGSAWSREIGDTPLNDVKTVWMHQLQNFRESAYRIDWALENLPERCPNAVAFKNLCAQAPHREAPALPLPAADPAVMAQVIAALQPVKGAKRLDPKAWAYRLKARQDAGEMLSMNQARCMNAALKPS